MKEIKTVITSYEVTDNYGVKYTFPKFKYAEACAFEEYVKRERKVLDYIKPTGVTLVVSLDDVFYKVFPGFIGFNGVPFCEAPKEKRRDYYMSSLNTVERSSSVYGTLKQVLQKAYKVTSNACMHSFDRWNGAYHYYWDTQYGNSGCSYMLHPDHWKKEALWYNWDGKHFATNDPNCKLTDKELLTL